MKLWNPSSAMTVSRGVALIFASTIGSGVFVCTGFMLGHFTPVEMLWAWCLGTLIAACGVMTYRIIGSQVSRSGGEYEYLSGHLPHRISALIGIGTILLGFVCPIAFDAVASAHFLFGTEDIVDGRIAASGLVVALTLVHGLCTRGSFLFQDLVSALKYVVVIAILVGGIFCLGNPTVVSATTLMDVHSAESGHWLFQQYWIAYAFSGFNAVIYVAGRFKNPTREVPKALLIGFCVVGVVILALNTLLIYTTAAGGLQLSTADGHELMNTKVMLETLVGSQYSALCAIALGIIFLGTTSACLLLAPDILGAMSRRGHWIRGSTHAQNTLLVALLALAAIWASSLRQLVVSFSAYMFLVAALTALTVLANKTRTLGSRTHVCVVTTYGFVNLFFVLVGIYHANVLTQCALGCLTLFFAFEYTRWVRTPSVPSSTVVNTRTEN